MVFGIGLFFNNTIVVVVGLCCVLGEFVRMSKIVIVFSGESSY